MTENATIYVALLGENVDVWRPVQAVRSNGNIYRIANQAYDREIESWQFEPGDCVRCELIDTSEGRILAAMEKA